MMLWFGLGPPQAFANSIEVRLSSTEDRLSSTKLDLLPYMLGGVGGWG